MDNKEDLLKVRQLMSTKRYIDVDGITRVFSPTEQEIEFAFWIAQTQIPEFCEWWISLWNDTNHENSIGFIYSLDKTKEAFCGLSFVSAIQEIEVLIGWLPF